MYQQANTQLPAPIDRWDASTFNQNLPNGNDVFPQINPPAGMAGQVMEMVASQFRTVIQNTVNRSPLHTMLYNLFSQNYFRNEMYTYWVQCAMDFTAFLMAAQNNPPNRAVEIAVKKVVPAALADTAARYPAINQYLQGDISNSLINAASEWNIICGDIKAFMQRQQMGNGGYGGGGGGYTNHQYNGGHTNHQYNAQMPINPLMNSAVRQSAPQGSPQGHIQHMQNTGVVTQSPSSGRYQDIPEFKPQSWDASTGYSQNNNQPQQVVEQRKEPVMNTLDENDVIDFLDISEIQIKPNKKPEDPLRPYDNIRYQGDIIVTPALLSGKKRTITDAKPYGVLYDPTRYVLFHIIHPDGFVTEKIHEWEEDMEYLQHELDDTLRGMKIKPTGRVIENTRYVLEINDAPAPIAAVAETVDSELSELSKVPPVIMSEEYMGNCCVDIEQEVRGDVIEQLGLDKDSKFVPAHVYISGKTTALDISEECFKALTELKDMSTLPQVAMRLRTMVETGLLPLRIARLLNDRLTVAFNRILAEQLAKPNLVIDSFMDDVKDMMSIIKRRYDEDLVEVIDTRTPAFLKRHLEFVICTQPEDEEEEKEEYALMSQYINFQVNWEYAKIGGLGDGQAALLKNSTHPELSKIVRLFHKECRDDFQGRTPRLITSDGVYLELIQGWLVEGSLLLRRVECE